MTTLSLLLDQWELDELKTVARRRKTTPEGVSKKILHLMALNGKLRELQERMAMLRREIFKSELWLGNRHNVLVGIIANQLNVPRKKQKGKGAKQRR